MLPFPSFQVPPAVLLSREYVVHTLGLKRKNVRAENLLSQRAPLSNVTSRPKLYIPSTVNLDAVGSSQIFFPTQNCRNFQRRSNQPINNNSTGLIRCFFSTCNICNFGLSIAVTFVVLFSPKIGQETEAFFCKRQECSLECTLFN